ncbi:MAG: DUF3306 domain-containing protein [Gammaproteobacteria bacterium]|nr:DUF3306 domain-containing protein [Gammaproteobacteria bacterium]
MTASDTQDRERPRPDETFLQRFHRRKLEARGSVADAAGLAGPADPIADASDVTVPDGEARPALTDADMPPLESLDDESDYRGFLSEKVSESLRRAALRKLFHSSAFNVVDGLDEYADDFTTFETLGDIVTADMRHQQEIEAQREAARIAERETAQAEADAAAEPIEAQAVADDDTADDGVTEITDAGAPDNDPNPTSDPHDESTSHT